MFCLRSMLAIANIVLPVFALIIAGYVLRRRNVLSTNACTELNRFVVYLALPALMIDVMVNSTWSELYQPEFFTPSNSVYSSSSSPYWPFTGSKRKT